MISALLQTILLNTLISEFVVLDNPLNKQDEKRAAAAAISETVQGLCCVQYCVKKDVQCSIALGPLYGVFLEVNEDDNHECQNKVTHSQQGLILLDTNLIVYGQFTWVVFDMTGKELNRHRRRRMTSFEVCCHHFAKSWHNSIKLINYIYHLS